MPPLLSAVVRERSTSSGEDGVSSTSSLWMDWIPILTSTVILSLVSSNSLPGRTSLVGGNRVAGPRPAADPPPGQPGHELFRGVLRDRPVGAQPVGGADLGHSDQAHAKQVRLLVADASVLGNDLADHLRAFPARLIQPGAHRGLVAQVRLEDQAERLAGAPDEVEEGGER